MTAPSTSDVHSAHDVRRVKMWLDTIGRQAKWPINGARTAVARYRVNDREQVPLGQGQKAMEIMINILDEKAAGNSAPAQYITEEMAAKLVTHS